MSLVKAHEGLCAALRRSVLASDAEWCALSQRDKLTRMCSIVRATSLLASEKISSDESVDEVCTLLFEAGLLNSLGKSLWLIIHDITIPEEAIQLSVFETKSQSAPTKASPRNQPKTKKHKGNKATSSSSGSASAMRETSNSSSNEVAPRPQFMFSLLREVGLQCAALIGKLTSFITQAKWDEKNPIRTQLWYACHALCNIVLAATIRLVEYNPFMLMSHVLSADALNFSTSVFLFAYTLNDTTLQEVVEQFVNEEGFFVSHLSPSKLDELTRRDHRGVWFNDSKVFRPAPPMIAESYYTMHATRFSPKPSLCMNNIHVNVSQMFEVVGQVMQLYAKHYSVPLQPQHALRFANEMMGVTYDTLIQNIHDHYMDLFAQVILRGTMLLVSPGNISGLWKYKQRFSSSGSMHSCINTMWDAMQERRGVSGPSSRRQTTSQKHYVPSWPAKPVVTKEVKMDTLVISASTLCVALWTSLAHNKLGTNIASPELVMKPSLHMIDLIVHGLGKLYSTVPYLDTSELSRAFVAPLCTAMSTETLYPSQEAWYVMLSAFLSGPMKKDAIFLLPNDVTTKDVLLSSKRQSFNPHFLPYYLYLGSMLFSLHELTVPLPVMEFSTMEPFLLTIMSHFYSKSGSGVFMTKNNVGFESSCLEQTTIVSIASLQDSTRLWHAVMLYSRWMSGRVESKITNTNSYLYHQVFSGSAHLRDNMSRFINFIARPLLRYRGPGQSELIQRFWEMAFGTASIKHPLVMQHGAGYMLIDACEHEMYLYDRNDEGYAQSVMGLIASNYADIFMRCLDDLVPFIVGVIPKEGWSEFKISCLHSNFCVAQRVISLMLPDHVQMTMFYGLLRILRVLFEHESVSDILPAVEAVLALIDSLLQGHTSSKSLQTCMKSVRIPLCARCDTSPHLNLNDASSHSNVFLEAWLAQEDAKEKLLELYDLYKNKVCATIEKMSFSDYAVPDVQHDNQAEAANPKKKRKVEVADYDSKNESKAKAAVLSVTHQTDLNDRIVETVFNQDCSMILHSYEHFTSVLLLLSESTTDLAPQEVTPFSAEQSAAFFADPSCVYHVQSLLVWLSKPTQILHPLLRPNYHTFEQVMVMLEEAMKFMDKCALEYCYGLSQIVWNTEQGKDSKVNGKHLHPYQWVGDCIVNLTSYISNLFTRHNTNTSNSRLLSVMPRSMELSSVTAIPVPEKTVSKKKSKSAKKVSSKASKKSTAVTEDTRMMLLESTTEVPFCDVLSAIEKVTPIVVALANIDQFVTRFLGCLRIEARIASKGVRDDRFKLNDDLFREPGDSPLLFIDSLYMAMWTTTPYKPNRFNGEENLLTFGSSRWQPRGYFNIRHYTPSSAAMSTYDDIKTVRGKHTNLFARFHDIFEIAANALCDRMTEGMVGLDYHFNTTVQRRYMSVDTKGVSEPKRMTPSQARAFVIVKEFRRVFDRTTTLEQVFKRGASTFYANMHTWTSTIAGKKSVSLPNVVYLPKLLKKWMPVAALNDVFSSKNPDVSIQRLRETIPFKNALLALSSNQPTEFLSSLILDMTTADMLLFPQWMFPSVAAVFRQAPAPADTKKEEKTAVRVSKRKLAVMRQRPVIQQASGVSSPFRSMLTIWKQGMQEATHNLPGAIAAMLLKTPTVFGGRNLNMLRQSDKETIMKISHYCFYLFDALGEFAKMQQMMEMHNPYDRLFTRLQLQDSLMRNIFTPEIELHRVIMSFNGVNPDDDTRGIRTVFPIPPVFQYVGLDSVLARWQIACGGCDMIDLSGISYADDGTCKMCGESLHSASSNTPLSATLVSRFRTSETLLHRFALMKRHTPVGPSLLAPMDKRETLYVTMMNFMSISIANSSITVELGLPSASLIRQTNNIICQLKRQGPAVLQLMLSISNARPFESWHPDLLIAVSMLFSHLVRDACRTDSTSISDGPGDDDDDEDMRDDVNERKLMRLDELPVLKPNGTVPIVNVLQMNDGVCTNVGKRKSNNATYQHTYMCHTCNVRNLCSVCMVKCHAKSYHDITYSAFQRAICACNGPVGKKKDPDGIYGKCCALPSSEQKTGPSQNGGRTAYDWEFDQLVKNTDALLDRYHEQDSLLRAIFRGDGHCELPDKQRMTSENVCDPLRSSKDKLAFCVSSTISVGRGGGSTTMRCASMGTQLCCFRYNFRHPDAANNNLVFAEGKSLAFYELYMSLKKVSSSTPHGRVTYKIDSKLTEEFTDPFDKFEFKIIGVAADHLGTSILCFSRKSVTVVLTDCSTDYDGPTGYINLDLGAFFSLSSHPDDGLLMTVKWMPYSCSHILIATRQHIAIFDISQSVIIPAYVTQLDPVRMFNDALADVCASAPFFSSPPSQEYGRAAGMHDVLSLNYSLFAVTKKGVVLAEHVAGDNKFNSENTMTIVLSGDNDEPVEGATVFYSNLLHLLFVSDNINSLTVYNVNADLTVLSRTSRENYNMDGDMILSNWVELETEEWYAPSLHIQAKRGRGVVAAIARNQSNGCSLWTFSSDGVRDGLISAELNIQNPECNSNSTKSQDDADRDSSDDDDDEASQRTNEKVVGLCAKPGMAGTDGTPPCLLVAYRSGHVRTLALGAKTVNTDSHESTDPFLDIFGGDGQIGSGEPMFVANSARSFFAANGTKRTQFNFNGTSDLRMFECAVLTNMVVVLKSYFSSSPTTHSAAQSMSNYVKLSPSVGRKTQGVVISQIPGHIRTRNGYIHAGVSGASTTPVGVRVFLRGADSAAVPESIKIVCEPFGVLLESETVPDVDRWYDFPFPLASFRNLSRIKTESVKIGVGFVYESTLSAKVTVADIQLAIMPTSAVHALFASTVQDLSYHIVNRNIFLPATLDSLSTIEQLWDQMVRVACEEQNAERMEQLMEKRGKILTMFRSSILDTHLRNSYTNGMGDGLKRALDALVCKMFLEDPSLPPMRRRASQSVKWRTKLIVEEIREKLSSIVQATSEESLKIFLGMHRSLFPTFLISKLKQICKEYPILFHELLHEDRKKEEVDSKHVSFDVIMATLSSIMLDECGVAVQLANYQLAKSVENFENYLHDIAFVAHFLSLCDTWPIPDTQMLEDHKALFGIHTDAKGSDNRDDTPPVLGYAHMVLRTEWLKGYADAVEVIQRMHDITDCESVTMELHIAAQVAAMNIMLQPDWVPRICTECDEKIDGTKVYGVCLSCLANGKETMICPGGDSMRISSDGFFNGTSSEVFKCAGVHLGNCYMAHGMATIVPFFGLVDGMGGVSSVAQPLSQLYNNRLEQLATRKRLLRDVKYISETALLADAKAMSVQLTSEEKILTNHAFDKLFIRHMRGELIKWLFSRTSLELNTIEYVATLNTLYPYVLDADSLRNSALSADEDSSLVIMDFNLMKSVSDGLVAHLQASRDAWSRVEKQEAVTLTNECLVKMSFMLALFTADDTTDIIPHASKVYEPEITAVMNEAAKLLPVVVTRLRQQCHAHECMNSKADSETCMTNQRQFNAVANSDETFVPNYFMADIVTGKFEEEKNALTNMLQMLLQFISTLGKQVTNCVKNVFMHSDKAQMVDQDRVQLSEDGIESVLISIVHDPGLWRHDDIVQAATTAIFRLGWTEAGKLFHLWYFLIEHMFAVVNEPHAKEFPSLMKQWQFSSGLRDSYKESKHRKLQLSAETVHLGPRPYKVDLYIDNLLKKIDVTFISNSTKSATLWRQYFLLIPQHFVGLMELALHFGPGYLSSKVLHLLSHVELRRKPGPPLDRNNQELIAMHAKTGKLAFSCAKKHLLFEFITYHPQFGCDECKKSPMGLAQTMFGCRRCDYDVCLSCVSKANKDKNADESKSSSDSSAIVESLLGSNVNLNGLLKIEVPIHAKQSLVGTESHVLSSFMKRFVLTEKNSLLRDRATKAMQFVFEVGFQTDSSSVLQSLRQCMTSIPEYGSNSMHLLSLVNLGLQYPPLSIHRQTVDNTLMQGTFIARLIFVLDSVTPKFTNHPLTQMYARLAELGAKPDMIDVSDGLDVVTMKTNKHIRERNSNNEKKNRATISIENLSLMPCAVCANKPDSTAVYGPELASGRVYQHNSVAYRFKIPHEFSLIVVSLKDCDVNRTVRKIEIYSHTKVVDDLRHVQSDQWTLVQEGSNLAPAIDVDVRFHLKVPIVTANIKIVFSDFNESEEYRYGKLVCPRCMSLVPPSHGNCLQCRENAHQCRQCRNINYEHLRGYLCNECGFSRHGDVEVSFTVANSLRINPIEDESDRKVALEKLFKLHKDVEMARSKLTVYRNGVTSLLNCVGDNITDVNRHSIRTAVINMFKQHNEGAQQEYLSGALNEIRYIQEELNKYAGHSDLQSSSSFEHGDFKLGDLLDEKYDVATDAGSDCVVCAYNLIAGIVSVLTSVDKRHWITMVNPSVQLLPGIKLVADRIYGIIDNILSCPTVPLDLIRLPMQTVLRNIFAVDGQGLKTLAGVVRDSLDSVCQHAATSERKETIRMYVSMIGTKTAELVESGDSLTDAQMQWGERMNVLTDLIMYSVQVDFRDHFICDAVLHPALKTLVKSLDHVRSLKPQSSSYQSLHDMVAPSLADMLVTSPISQELAQSNRFVNPFSPLLTSRLDSHLQSRQMPELSLMSSPPASMELTRSRSIAAKETTSFLYLLPPLLNLNLRYNLVYNTNLNVRHALSGNMDRKARTKILMRDVVTLWRRKTARSLALAVLRPVGSSTVATTTAMDVSSDHVTEPMLTLSRVNTPLLQRSSPIRAVAPSPMSPMVSVTTKPTVSFAWLERLVLSPSEKVQQEGCLLVKSLCFHTVPSDLAKKADSKERESKYSSSSSSRPPPVADAKRKSGPPVAKSAYFFLVLDMALRVLHRISVDTEAYENCGNFVALIRQLMEVRDAREYLVVHGMWDVLLPLIQKQVDALYNAEANFHSHVQTAVAPMVLYGLTQTLVSLMNVPRLKDHFRENHAAEVVVELFLRMRSLVVQRTPISDDCALCLFHVVQCAYGDSMEDKQEMILAYVRAFTRSRKTEQGAPSQAMVRMSIFALEQMCSLVDPEKKERVVQLSLKKSRTQEEFIRGEMTKNPYASSEFDGPLMSHVKDKICENLGLMDAANMFELLVAGKLIDLSLPIVGVYDKVWKAHLEEQKNNGNNNNNGSRSPHSDLLMSLLAGGPGSVGSDHLGRRMLLRSLVGGGSEGKGRELPMRVVYRLTGLDGEATEEVVDSLPADKAAEQELDPNIEFAVTTCLTTDVTCRGLLVLLKALETEVILLSSLKIRKPHEKVQSMRSAELLVRLIDYACRVTVNREYLLNQVTENQLAVRMRPAAYLSANAVHLLVQMMLDLICIGDANMLPTVQTMLTVVLSLTEYWYNTADASLLKPQDLLTVSTVQLKVLLNVIDTPYIPSGEEDLFKNLVRLLPLLTFGAPAMLEVLFDYVTPALTLIFNKNAALSSKDVQRLQLFQQICEAIPSRKTMSSVNSSSSSSSSSSSMDGKRWDVGTTLRHYFLTKDTLRQLFQFILDNIDVSTAADDAKAATMTPVDARMPCVLASLIGLCRDFSPACELALQLGVVSTLHRLEGKASAKKIGPLAESLLEVLKSTDNKVDESLKVLRLDTREKKKKRAMAKRKKMLANLGFARSKSKEAKTPQLLSTTSAHSFEDLEEEKGLKCTICHEGYTLRPDDSLGLYVFDKEMGVYTRDINDYFDYGRNSSTSDKKTKRVVHTVTHFHVIHYSCHRNAARADRNLKPPKSEWEGATIRNGHTLTNNLLPIFGGNKTRSEFGAAMDSYMSRARNLSSKLGNLNRVELLCESLKGLLLTFAQEASFSKYSKGGERGSNIKLIPFLFNAAQYYDGVSLHVLSTQKSLDLLQSIGPFDQETFYMKPLSTKKLLRKSALSDGEYDMNVLTPIDPSVHAPELYGLLLDEVLMLGVRMAVFLSPDLWEEQRLLVLTQMIRYGYLLSLHKKDNKQKDGKSSSSSSSTAVPIDEDSSFRGEFGARAMFLYWGLLDRIQERLSKGMLLGKEDGFRQLNIEEAEYWGKDVLNWFTTSLLPNTSVAGFVDVLDLHEEVTEQFTSVQVWSSKLFASLAAPEDKDLEVVMAKTGEDRETCIAALLDANGSVVDAILTLT